MNIVLNANGSAVYHYGIGCGTGISNKGDISVSEKKLRINCLDRIKLGLLVVACRKLGIRKKTNLIEI